MSALDWPGWCRGRQGRGPRDRGAARARRRATRRSRAGRRRRFAARRRLRHRRRRVGAPGRRGTASACPRRRAERTGGRSTDREAERLAAIVEAAWTSSTRSPPRRRPSCARARAAAGATRDKIVEHVVGADDGYAREHRPQGAESPERPDGRPRSGPRCSRVLRQPSGRLAARRTQVAARYAARRIAWHALDHAWEIEDRTEPRSGGGSTGSARSGLGLDRRLAASDARSRAASPTSSAGVRPAARSCRTPCRRPPSTASRPVALADQRMVEEPRRRRPAQQRAEPDLAGGRVEQVPAADDEVDALAQVVDDDARTRRSSCRPGRGRAGRRRGRLAAAAARRSRSIPALLAGARARPAGPCRVLGERRARGSRPGSPARPRPPVRSRPRGERRPDAVAARRPGRGAEPRKRRLVAPASDWRYGVSRRTRRAARRRRTRASSRSSSSAASYSGRERCRSWSSIRSTTLPPAARARPHT